ncbi:hypothetical protein [Streptomyces fuscichromogenes]|uniref:Uncharacterized protein n=1 Tax=Streptomyces fuscichromogenes TaxID=1324013 RepID=A0A917XN04_9ACTN|nr:hypothetical protein [Streptomyces fuscichromogenes]GGN40934.1 hypothetical protein GCM10011578_088690 [Streptomyces fuscichromogenes]
MNYATRAPDPYAVLTGWLSGAYVRPDGQEGIGRVWDEDTKYRYGLRLAGREALPGWKQDWFRYIGDLVWHFEPLHIQDWASRLTAFDGTGTPPGYQPPHPKPERVFHLSQVAG